MDYRTKDEPKRAGTGSHTGGEHHKIVTYPFGKYEIKIELTEDDRFVSILEVKISKDFLSEEQKRVRTGVHDVDDLYRE